MRLLYLFLFVSSVFAERKSYKGHALVALTPYTSLQLEILRNEMRYNSYDMEFWTHPRKIRVPTHVLLTPHCQLKPTHWFSDIPMEVISENVQTDLDAFMAEFDKRSLNSTFDPNAYNTLEQIEAWMDDQAAKCAKTHGHHCSVETIGQSHEGRPLKVFHLKKDGLDKHRQSYWIDATIHAREWLATATILKVMDFMLTNYEKDEVATRLVRDYDWYFMPVMNPDGYAFTYHPDGDRLWRKNRRPHKVVNDRERELLRTRKEEVKDCIGIDLNRNFDWKWANERTCRFPRGSTYRGPSPASEPETQAVQRKAAEVADHINAWISLHAYGNLVTYPWGTTEGNRGKFCEKAEDHENLERVAWATADAAHTSYGTNWEHGSTCQIIQNTSGDLADYVKGVLGVNMAFTVSLGGTNFYPPPSEIPHAFEEFWRGLHSLVGMTDRTKTECG